MVLKVLAAFFLIILFVLPLIIVVPIKAPVPPTARPMPMPAITLENFFMLPLPFLIIMSAKPKILFQASLYSPILAAKLKYITEFERY